MAKRTRQERVAELAKKTELTEEECRELFGGAGVREVKLAPEVRLPAGAFAPGEGKGTAFLYLNGVTVSERHLADLARWPLLTKLDLADSRIDEEGLAALASSPKLETLWLEGTNLSDRGLRHVGRIGTLRWVTLGRTRVTDKGLAELKSLAKLKTLWVNGTKVTDAGLLRLAGSPKLSVIRAEGSGVTAAGQEALFRAQQERIKTARQAKRAAPGAKGARPARASATAGDAADLGEAIAVVKEFAAAMAAWERACMAGDRRRPRTRREADARDRHQRESCRAIFDRYCTHRKRATSRPNAIHYGSPSDYDPTAFVIEGAEPDGGRRIYVHARDGRGSRCRIAVVRKQDGWRVDNKQAWMGGWTSTGL